MRKLLTFQMGLTSAFKRQSSGLLAGSLESSLRAPGSHLVIWEHRRWKEARTRLDGHPFATASPRTQDEAGFLLCNQQAPPSWLRQS